MRSGLTILVSLALGFLLGTFVERGAPRALMSHGKPPVWCKVNDKMEMVVLCKGD